MKRTTSFGRAKILFVLQKIPFFKPLTPHEREKLVDHAEFYIAQEGELIIEQGTLDTAFYVLMSGNASVVVNGVKEPVANVEPGSFFGEMSFLLNTPRSSNVISKKLCVLIRIDRRLLGKLDSTIREKMKDQIIVKLANTIVEHNQQMQSSEK
ncbi:MAG: CRP/FNR family cyclic AMP-dependent transcriptional regulator [Candidatus Paceibacteria bacterium]